MSTNSQNKQLLIPATGDFAGTWGTQIDNGYLTPVDGIFGSTTSITLASTDHTITTGETQTVFHDLTGTLSGNVNVVYPANAGGYYVLDNQTTGAFTVTVKQFGGTGVVIPQSARSLIKVDNSQTAASFAAAPDILSVANAVITYTGTTYAQSRITPQIAVALVDGSTPALDASKGNTFTLTSTTNPTIAVPSNPTAWQRIVIAFTASGGARTLALNTGAGGFEFGTDIPALSSTTSGKTDLVGAVYNGSVWYVVAYIKGFS